MAERPAGCLETLGDPGQRTDARPGSSSEPRLRQAAGLPRNVTVEPTGAVPGRRGPGGYGCPARPRPAPPSRWV